MSPDRQYSDDQAKKKLLDTWKYRPTSWDGHWVRTRPSQGSDTMPALVRPGTIGGLTARTEADGMYVRLAENAVTADVLAIEVCTSLQNLHDKRSRYAPSTSSLLLKLNRKWLSQDQVVQNTTKKRWETFGDSLSALPDEDLLIPVFRLRLFLMAPCKNVKAWGEKIALEAHEYLLPHRALDNQYATDVTDLLDHAFHRRVWVPQ